VVGRAAGRAQVGERQAVSSGIVAVGEQAPDFTLRDQNNEEVTLSSFRGDRAVLLVFYPLAFTGICTGELCVVRDDLGAFQNDDVQVMALSVDSVYSHKVFSERERYDFPLLSDFWPHGAVAQRYGVFNETRGFANRGTFLVDKDGVVRFAEMNQPSEGRDAGQWRAAIEALTGVRT
jgi:peroxiredoxin (alkyl hydroperoxide reductase subunit C)